MLQDCKLKIVQKYKRAPKTEYIFVNCNCVATRWQ